MSPWGSARCWMFPLDTGVFPPLPRLFPFSHHGGLKYTNIFGIRKSSAGNPRAGWELPRSYQFGDEDKASPSQHYRLHTMQCRFSTLLTGHRLGKPCDGRSK